MKTESGLASVLKRIIFSSLPMAILTIFLIAAAIVTALLPPLVLEHIVNGLAAQIEIPIRLAFVYFGALALSGLLEAGQNVIITAFGQRVTHGLRSEMCAKLSRLPASYYAKNEAGKISALFVGDVDVVDSLFTNGIISMFADTFKIVGILAVIFIKSTGLGIIMLLVTPLLFILTRQFQKHMLEAQLQNRVAVGKINNHVPETLRNIRMIKTLFRQEYMAKKYDDYMDESYHAMEKSNLYDSLYSPIVVFVSALVISIMMVFSSLGAQMQQFFGISVGTAVAIIAYVGKVFDPLESIGMEIQNIQSAVAGVKRIQSFLNEPEREQSSAPNESTGFAPSQPCIVFDSVNFGYEGNELILKKLCLCVERGQAITLCGRTGAGKSTIFRLVLGLYSPWSGKVLINGEEAAKIPDDKKRRLFGYVEQSFRLVDGTAAQQISLFDPHISQDQIEAAARLVGLHETLFSLPDGYDTPALDLHLSQGQLQLLSIARAVVSSPEILLLDECTANLDSDTEGRVLKALECACSGRTVLSISHRLSESIGSKQVIRIGE